MAKQIGMTKTFDQIAHGRVPVTHKVVGADGKAVGYHANEQDAKAHAQVLNAHHTYYGGGPYFVQPA